jgi:hypothetical protein
VARATKYCPTCGGTYPVGFFRRDNSAHICAEGRTRAICKGCEQTARDREKARDRWKGKARDTTRFHAKRMGVAVSILTDHYGWVLDDMAHDAKHAADNSCPYCRRPFTEMEHGFWDVTLDIHDPAKEPFYSTNTKWICATCNRQKKQLSPSEWAETLIGWRMWERQQQSRIGFLPFDR